MSKLLDRAKVLLASPSLRPVEVWLLRAAIVYLAAKLGVTADHLVK